jgi:hypothetical protein
MENPQSWGKLEHVIADALDDHEKSMNEGVIGYSQVMTIANKLRAEGLVLHDPAQREALAQQGECECLAGNCTC